MPEVPGDWEAHVTSLFKRDYRVPDAVEEVFDALRRINQAWVWRAFAVEFGVNHHDFGWILRSLGSVAYDSPDDVYRAMATQRVFDYGLDACRIPTEIPSGKDAFEHLSPHRTRFRRDGSAAE